MHTVTVTARETFPYAGITRRAGDSFEASVEDARILRLIGKVADAPPVTQSTDGSLSVDLAAGDDDTAFVIPPKRGGRRRAQTADAITE